MSETVGVLPSRTDVLAGIIKAPRLDDVWFYRAWQVTMKFSKTALPAFTVAALLALSALGTHLWLPA